MVVEWVLIICVFLLLIITNEMKSGANNIHIQLHPKLQI